MQAPSKKNYQDSTLKFNEEFSQKKTETQKDEEMEIIPNWLAQTIGILKGQPQAPRCTKIGWLLLVLLKLILKIIDWVLKYKTPTEQ